MPLIHDALLDAPPVPKDAKPAPEPTPAPRRPAWPVHRFIEEHAPPGWSIESNTAKSEIKVSWAGSPMTVVIDGRAAKILACVWFSGPVGKVRADIASTESILAFAEDLGWFLRETEKANP